LCRAGIGSEEAGSSARLLAEYALGWDRARFLTLAHEPEPPDFAKLYAALVRRRATREPSAYITGQKEFWGLSFEVSSDVLIPRPETELIVEAALELFGRDCERAMTIADAFTGSGCLAIALASELHGASFVATDISDRALDVARRNAVRHRVADRICFKRINVLDGADGPFDLIVANPPYVRQGDEPALQPEVREYEPAVALYGGDSGLDFVATVVEQSAARLRSDGYLMFEFGCGQDPAVEELIQKAEGLTMVALRRDLQGVARTAIARRTRSEP
jgi:release factor glutamine methyltransferase